jgi:outer membrane protein OmpA-like peptidoglycan-associated protein
MGGMSITTEGRGDQDPVVSTCGWQINARTIACNAPNRRVVLGVMWQRR